MRDFGRMIENMVFVENSSIMAHILRASIRMGNRRDRVFSGDRMSRTKGNG